MRTLLLGLCVTGCWRDSVPPSKPAERVVAPVVVAPVASIGQCQALRMVGDVPNGAVGAAELEGLVEKQGPATRCCWLKARHRKLADTKVLVTLTVANEGSVGAVKLSDVEPQLGTCLVGVIEGWRFQPSKGGTFRFAIQFAD